MKQDKGSGVAIMNKPRYQVTKLNHDPTKKDRG